MIRKTALSAVAALALAATAAPAHAASVVFSDTTLNPADYAVTTYTGAAGFTTNAFQATGVGGAGTSLATSYEKQGPTSPAARFQALNSDFVYDPSASGAIQSIDVAFDGFISLYHDLTMVNLANGSAQARVIAQQDGNLYMAARNVFQGLPFESWYHVATTGFVASDFTLFNPANPFAPRTPPNLDFTGSAITFGFEIAHFGVTVGGGPSTGLVRSTMALDNFQLTLNTQDPVGGIPEPTTWLLMIGGFGLAGAALRRSRRSEGALA